MFNCDPIDMHKLFKNLIENAVKYSDFKQKIEVKLYKENKNIVFSVKDYGIGIDISHQERIFERFYRIDKGRLEGGTGLGLAIVKHIVLKYKGKIDLQSKLGQGSVFTVKIPIFNESIFIKNILA
ncbi:MAG: sensor histidine kinase [Acholeplasmataceae bacterium]